MSIDGQGTKWPRNIAENFYRLSRVHERYRRQTTDRRTDDDIRSRSLKIREGIGEISEYFTFGLGLNLQCRFNEGCCTVRSSKKAQQLNVNLRSSTCVRQPNNNTYMCTYVGSTFRELSSVQQFNSSDTRAVSLRVGCYHLHPPLSFIITQPKSQYCFTIPQTVKG